MNVPCSQIIPAAIFIDPDFRGTGKRRLRSSGLAKAISYYRRIKLAEWANVYNADRILLPSCDVSDRDAVKTLASVVAAEWGAVDGLVNNAGINTNPRSSSPRYRPAPAYPS